MQVHYSDEFRKKILKICLKIFFALKICKFSPKILIYKRISSHFLDSWKSKPTNKIEILTKTLLFIILGGGFAHHSRAALYL